MKKLSLLLGTLGGAMAGYLFSNKQLREELTNAKDAESAAKVLGKHLQKDGKKVAKEMQLFMESEDVQRNLNKAKEYAREKADQAKVELQALVGKGAKEAKKAIKKGSKQAKKSAKQTAKRVRAKVKRMTK